VVASGTVDRNYKKVIPFRQLEFKAMLLKWVILDNIKHRKVTSGRLAEVIKIANLQAVRAMPSSSSTLAAWIHDMFSHFEPQIIAEIRTAKSRISVSFDGWGSKHEKISVLGIVVHFINEQHKNVTRLIGLPELPKHKKAGVGKTIDLFYWDLLILMLTYCIRSVRSVTAGSSPFRNQLS
jgi:hypothetical protein